MQIFAQQIYISRDGMTMRTIEEHTEILSDLAIGDKTFYAVLDIELKAQDGKSQLSLKALRVPVAASTISEAFEHYNAAVAANVGDAIAHELRSRDGNPPRPMGYWVAPQE